MSRASAFDTATRSDAVFLRPRASIISFGLANLAIENTHTITIHVLGCLHFLGSLKTLKDFEDIPL